VRNKLIKLIKPPLSTRFDRVCHPFPKASKEPVLVFLALTVTIGRGSPPDFLWNLVALVNFMRLSSRKGARAVLSSASRQEIRVREMAKKCELSELIRLLRGFFGFGGL